MSWTQKVEQDGCMLRFLCLWMFPDSCWSSWRTSCQSVPKNQTRLIYFSDPKIDLTSVLIWRRRVSLWGVTVEEPQEQFRKTRVGSCFITLLLLMYTCSNDKDSQITEVNWIVLLLFWVSGSDHVGSCWIMLDHVGPCWILLDHIGLRWTMLDPVGPRWTTLDHVGPRWILLDHAGPHWTMLDHVGSCWSVLGLFALLKP